MNRLLEWLAKLPTTNARIAVTLLVFTGTAIRYWSSPAGIHQWIPSWEWLMFLMTMAGLDVLQHYVKRATEWKPTIRPGGAPGNTIDKEP